jgi:hypothetical protein
MKTDFQDRYKTALSSIPAPGAGCHTALLSVANYGILGGVEPATIHKDIRQSIPQGGRFVPDKEIEAAIKKATADIELRSDGSGTQYRFTITTPPKPQAVILPDYTQRLIDKAAGIGEVDLWELSPVRLTDDPAEDWRLFIRAIFSPTDYIFIGSLYDTHLRQAMDVLSDKRPEGQYICPNTFYEGTKRQDSDILAFRYCIVEFDDIPLDSQLKFWAAIPLPVAALIYSGGKSIHALIKLQDVNSIEDWQKVVKSELFQKRLNPLGVDTATSNPSRTTRTPSVPRGDTWQRLLYLNPRPTGKAILDK